MREEKIENRFKVTIPLITEEDIRVLNNDFDGIVHRFSKMFIKEKDLAEAQYIVRRQQEQIEELKRNSIPKKKIEDKIEELNIVENAEALEDIMNRQDYTITELVQFVLQELLEE